MGNDINEKKEIQMTLDEIADVVVCYTNIIHRVVALITIKCDIEMLKEANKIIDEELGKLNGR